MGRGLTPNQPLSRSPVNGTEKLGRDVNWMFATPIIGHINILKMNTYEEKKLIHFDYKNLNALENNLVAHICGAENPDDPRLSLPLNSKCYFNEGKSQRYKGLTIFDSLERITELRDVGNCCKVICEKGDLIYTLKLDQECSRRLEDQKPTTEKIHDFCNSY